MGKGIERSIRVPDSWLEANRISRRQLLSRGAWLTGTVLLAPTWLLEACSNGSTTSTSSSSVPKKGGKIIWGWDTDPVYLIPFGSDATAVYAATVFLYEGLLRWDKDLNVQPSLAESYTIPDDHTYVFKLRQGVKFHTGKEMIGEDVKYSIELQKTPPPPGADSGFYPAIDHVEVVDNYTVKIVMAKPDQSLLGYLAWSRFSGIIPKGAYDTVDLKTKEVGTGPFKIQEFVPQDHITFVRNPDYWRPGLPYLDQITGKILADEQSRVAALRAGQIDGCTIGADSALVLANDANVSVITGVQVEFQELEIKIPGGPKKPWNDVRVRQAVNYAINRQEIIDKVYGGHAVYSSKIAPGYGDWAPTDADLKATWEKTDINQAKQLLAQAGFANGFSVTLNSIANPVEYTQIAQLVKQQLQAVNINVTVQPQEIGTFVTHDGDGSFEWESTGRGFRPDPSGFMADFDPNGGVYQAWFKGGWSNDKMTQLVAQGKQEPDQAKRHDLYRQMNEVMTDWPVIPLVDPAEYQGIRKRLHGMYVAKTLVDPGLIEAWVD